MKMLAAGFLFSLTLCGTALAQSGCDQMLGPIHASHTNPPYPAEALRRGESGTTEMRVTLNADGAPTGVEITRSSGSPRLDEAAVAHIQKVWRWDPAKGNCRAPVRIVWNILEPEGDIMDAAAVLNPPLTEYPAEARNLERQTPVGVLVSISEDGSLLATRVFQGSGIAALDASTLEFVGRRYTWTPAQVSGKPVRSEIRVVVRWDPRQAR